MGCLHSTPPLHAYYSPLGELITFERPKKHSAKREYQSVEAHDAKRFHPNAECYLLCTLWHESWLDFVLKKTKVPPGAISNSILLEEKRDLLRHNVKPKKDFRPINKAVWEFFFRLYGGGPVITFRVPDSFTEEEYLKGTWVKRIVFDQIVTIIHPSPFPAVVAFNQPAAGWTDNPMASSHVETAVSHMLDDVSSKKLKEAKNVEKEINKTNVEAIGMLMNKDRGKNMMKEGAEKEKQANEALSHSVAHQFAGNVAENKLKEAKSTKQKAEESQKNEMAAVFAAGSLKKQFKAALKTKNRKLITDLAARMLQNAWSGKKARKRALLLRQQRQRLLEEGYARKLQSRYRVHLAQRKVKRLREEQQRLKEEGAAIMFQSAWRVRKARQKVAELKAKKQRLLEEFAALKVQSRWRIRQAKAKVGALKEKKRELLAKGQRAAVVILKLLRAQRARRIYNQLLSQSKHVLVIDLKRAEDVLIGDVSSSDPYVYVHLDQPPLQSPTSDNRGRLASSAPPDGGFTLSQYRSKVIYNTLNPVWNEECLAVVNSKPEAISALQKLVFTVMDKDNFTSDDFLGQVSIPLSSIANDLYDGKVVALEKKPIGKLDCLLRDNKGKRISLQNTEHNGKGFLYATVRLADPTRSHHGWLMKLASQRIGFGMSTNFKPRFVTLNSGKLRYFEDELSLDHPRGSIDCLHVTQLSYSRDKEGMFLLNIKTPAEDWYFHWMEGEDRANQLVWLRKLHYNCTATSLNGLPRRQVLDKLPSLLTGEGLVTPGSNKKAARRVSSFFGTG